jgi:glycosyltransferase involved in cell wall biosynthesis
MSEPLISFVVPTKNRVEWLPECLSGLLTQSVNDVELVVVNDGSDDGTKELLDDFYAKDPRVKVIHNESSIGGGLSRNRGNEVATAPIIAVCDDDDFYTQDRAEKTLEFFKKFPEGVMMNAPYVQVGYCNEMIQRFDGAAFDESGFKSNGAPNFFCHPTAAYTKKDILEIGGYKPENKQFTDDYQLVQDWIKAGKKIGFVPGHYLCGHRVLPNSMMSEFRGFDPAWVGK